MAHLLGRHSWIEEDDEVGAKNDGTAISNDRVWKEIEEYIGMTMNICDSFVTEYESVEYNLNFNLRGKSFTPLHCSQVQTSSFVSTNSQVLIFIFKLN